MTKKHYTIEILRTARRRDADDLHVLALSLGAAHPPAPTLKWLRSVIRTSETKLIVAKSPEGCIVGMTVLGTVVAYTGTKTWIEDVVVAEHARGNGIGEALVQFAIAQAEADGATHINLSCREHRRAANRLYERVGFERQETNYYRYSLKEIASVRSISDEADSKSLIA